MKLISFTHYSTPLHIYKQVKNIFIKPICKFYFSKNNYWYYTESILDIHIFDLQWKDKYNTPRHEQNPSITIILFKKYTFHWEWKFFDSNGKDVSMEYWEAILCYLYYNYPVQKALEYSIWENCKTHEKTKVYEFVK